ncbi:Crp/Fnr family transcriptional regulator [Tepidibacter thalassicus]|uniref:cAMP-binding domain of CRP or a regulatory subunit of cAMP-dependent protein kinases n=1 Tax=Tepidibacter thalassicus DSM 15285 TaxID=1123350 RepID=A0A1M5RKU1_9FIRM|nr:Crp/Fnr family transcriptional regulator [Tepidibacter thalassicus]SHH26972.1 cAMP-binding domain of CRP or a regulatory subunit of cAMP-dependent protein kinases [Tepidibacter thalassicus DSM 15285]
MKNISNILSNSILFKNKTQQEINIALSSINYIIKHYKKGDLIFSVDQPPKYIGIILEGCIEVQKNLASGKVISILYKKKGDLFGEGSAFSKASTYPCNIFAKTKSTILLITKQNILNLLSKDSLLLTNFLNSFANRILLLNLKTELLSYSSIQQKIAFSLLYLMNEYKYNNVIFLPYSKKTWSEHLNVSRPSLFRELKILCNQKIIQIQNRTITILNENYLLNLLNQ